MKQSYYLFSAGQLVRKDNSITVLRAEAAKQISRWRESMICTYLVR